MSINLFRKLCNGVLSFLIDPHLYGTWRKSAANTYLFGNKAASISVMPPTNITSTFLDELV